MIRVATSSKEKAQVISSVGDIEMLLFQMLGRVVFIKNRANF